MCVLVEDHQGQDLALSMSCSKTEWNRGVRKQYPWYFHWKTSICLEDTRVEDRAISLGDKRR